MLVENEEGNEASDVTPEDGHEKNLFEKNPFNPHRLNRLVRMKCGFWNMTICHRSLLLWKVDQTCLLTKCRLTEFMAKRHRFKNFNSISKKNHLSLRELNRISSKRSEINKIWLGERYKFPSQTRNSSLSRLPSASTRWRFKPWVVAAATCSSSSWPFPGEIDGWLALERGALNRWSILFVGWKLWRIMLKPRVISWLLNRLKC